MNMVWRDDGGYLFTVGGPAQSNITTGSTNDGVRVWNHAGTRTAGNLIAFGDGGASPGAIVVSRGQRSVPSDYAAGPLVEGSVGNVDAAASAASCRGCGALAAPCSEGCQVHRRAAEAPLVALVSAVPEGLVPRGWTAAVLAAYESYAPLREDVEHPEEWGAKLGRGLVAAVAGGDEQAIVGATGSRLGSWTATAVMKGWAAYLRAIASPGPRPQPERWRGGRDVRLVVDDGRDND